MREEFARLEKSLNEAQPSLEMVILHEEPARTRPGMVVQADGTDWDPGSGAGVYLRDATNTSWVPTWVGGGSGTVTSVSVVSANGFAGTVATAATTPAITLTTTLTGLLKGNGTAMSAAAAGTDYVAPGGALGTPSSGTLTNCTFPTLNQNTTGSAAKWTTARNLAGNSVDGSANVAFANKFIVQGTTDTGLSAAQFLGALATGIVKNTTTTGVLSIAAAGTDYVAPGGALGTPSSGTLTNCTGLPISSGVSGLGANVATFLATPTSANFAAAISDDVGTWTPVLTFATPGTLSVAYTTQVGTWSRSGNTVTVDFEILTSSFTLGTASGNLFVNGLAGTFTASSAGNFSGTMCWQGITKSGYTQITPLLLASGTTIVFRASGSAVANSTVTATDTPTGGTVRLQGQLTFRV
jgi:hypothetical protein